ncbi:MAG: type II toxin-antitoxin system ParD family antitoxin [Phycisphaerales bacterium]
MHGYTPLNIVLPSEMETWIRQQARKGKYRTASEFVKQVLLRAQVESTREGIDAKLIEALDSGPSSPMSGEAWSEVRRDGKRRLAAMGKSRASRRKSA